jgi:AAA+ superfamily predicted ATPase
MATLYGLPRDIGSIEIDKESCLHDLLPAFRRLDQRLKLLAGAWDKSESALDTQPYPGLTISRNEISRLLELEPGMPAFTLDDVLSQGPLFDPSEDANANSKLVWLAREYDLSFFDLDVILIAFATELDLRYERIFAYLQDDITCTRPTLDLALNLLCHSTSAREASRTHFTPDGPLIRNKLLHLRPDPDRERSILARQLRLDDGVINLLLGVKGLDPRLAAFCQLIDSPLSLADVPIDSDLKRALQVHTTRASTRALRLHFRGPAGTPKRQTAEALAGQTNSRLLIVVDIEQALEVTTDFDQSLRMVLREARLRQALLYFENVDILLTEERAVSYRQLLTALNETSSAVIISSEKPLGSSLRIYEVEFLVPDFAQRRTCWEANLLRRSIALDAETLDTLAGSFRLPSGEIEMAVTAAIDRAGWRASQQPVADSLSAPSATPTAHDLFACARARSTHHLGRFARKIEPRYTWADLVLPADQLSQLREISARYKHQHVVYGQWGFGRKLSLGKGLNALFSGHPGTGKTMAAEVIAGEIHLDLYKIDLSQVVSKYIGETEKSLNRIFLEAQASSSILFFDEADALFGKRTEVKDSHDRYANIEVSYLLQKMEEYDGIAILATNLRQNMDEAFLRRMQFIVEFPFPDEESRRRIWEVLFPREAPIASDVDFPLLAREVRLAGGNLKNIGLAAAFYAAGDGRVIRQQHLVRAVRRELQKMGRSWNERDWKIEEKSGSGSRPGITEAVSPQDD